MAKFKKNNRNNPGGNHYRHRPGSNRNDHKPKSGNHKAPKVDWLQYSEEYGHEFKLRKVIEVLWPYFRVRLKVLASQKPENVISDIHKILLELIRNGYKTTADISLFLGLENKNSAFVLDELFTLSNRGLISSEVSGGWQVMVSDEEIIPKLDEIRFDQDTQFTFLIEGFSGRIIQDHEIESKEGENKLPKIFEGKRPTFDFLYENWISICQTYSRENEGSELIDFANYKESIDYGDLFWEESTIFFYSKDDDEDSFRIDVRKKTGKKEKGKSGILQKYYLRHPEVLDFSGEESVALKYQAILETQQPHSETEEETKNLAEYEHLADFQAKEKLNDALNSAKFGIYLESPWIKKPVIEIKEKIRTLLKKKVHVILAFGISLDDHNDHLQDVVNDLRKMESENREYFKLIYLPDHFAKHGIRNKTGSHRKILIKDFDFYVTGSFNFLSNNANPDRKYALEQSTLFRKDVQRFWEQVFQENCFPVLWIPRENSTSSSIENLFKK